MEFEWDDKKESKNRLKHSISFVHSIESFRDPNGIMLRDVTHSKSEDRYYWVGRDSKGIIISTRFTLRQNKIRIIGCGIWRKYKKYYDQKEG